MEESQVTQSYNDRSTNASAGLPTYHDENPGDAAAEDRRSDEIDKHQISFPRECRRQTIAFRFKAGEEVCKD